jgi:tetratricopeptide (TPR) repeat protein
MASSLRAGRLIRGSVANAGDRTVVSAEYIDLRTGLVHSAQEVLPADSGRRWETFMALADSLVLRGRTDGSRQAASERRSLLATQLFIDAMTAHRAWDLDAADTLLTRLVRLGGSAGRAHAWLAQVRSWNGRPTEEWITSVDRAIADSASLRAEELLMMRGLALMAGEDYPQACEHYRALVAHDPRNFAGWYGLGECHIRDEVVLPDARSVSGWRFRGSYQQAVDGFTRAFELLPATYSGFAAGGYSRLRVLLFTSARRVQPGRRDGSRRTEFLARPVLSGDTLVLVPWKQEIVMSGDPRAASSREAILALRRRFHQIAARWSGAFPGSPGAREALAISLELQGNRAALDTMRAAAALATSPSDRARLAASATLLLFKFSLPRDPRGLGSALREADSLLRANRSPTSQASAGLAPLAALVGDCARTAALIRSSASPLSHAGHTIPADVVGDVHVWHAHAVLGCGSGTNLSLDAVTRRANISHLEGGSRIAAENMLLGQLVRSRFPLDSSWTLRLAEGGDYLLHAQARAITGQPDSARAVLNKIARGRSGMLPGELALESVLPEALLWLRLGDTLTATRGLRESLENIDHSGPMSTAQAANNTLQVAAIIRAVGLMAELERVEPNVWMLASQALRPGARTPAQRQQ